MDRSSNSAHTNSMTIPSFFQSRLSSIADKLGVTPEQTIQALFTWTEMGLSLAEQLEVEDLAPQAIIESVRKLQTKTSNNLSSRDFDLSESATLNSHSLNQLATSIRLLSEALSKKHHPSSSSVSNQENSRKLFNRSVEAEEEVNRAIDAIIEFNNQENLPDNDKWRIGISALRKLTQRGDSVTKKVLEQRADQIKQHHAQHQLSPRHNSKGNTYPSIDEVISL